MIGLTREARAVYLRAGSEPEWRTAPRGLQLGLGVVAATALGFGLAAVVREPFTPLRLALKGIAPAVATLPIALALPAGRLRSGAVATISVIAMTLLTALCLAVYGVPMRADVLLPFLALTPPALGPVVMALTLLAGMTAAGLRFDRISMPARSVVEVLLAAAETVYFMGFLLGATRSMGPGAWALVAAAQVLSVLGRGVPARRAIWGSAAVVAAALWSGSPYVAFLVHLSLLGRPDRPGPLQRTRLRRGIRSEGV